MNDSKSNSNYSLKNKGIVQEFYEPLTSSYHLMFSDWNTLMREQGVVIAKLLPPPEITGALLDCTCGIGTQALALAALGYNVDGLDLSQSEIERAKKEASLRGVCVNFRQDDVLELKTAPLHHYGAVISMDNALPHLDSDEEIMIALNAIKARLKSGGQLLLSLRDYEKIMKEKVNVDPPKFFQDGQYRRIVHQVWDWQSERRYVLHLYITCETPIGWTSHHFTGRYRAITVSETAALVKEAGFSNVTTLSLGQTGFHQPIIQASNP